MSRPVAIPPPPLIFIGTMKNDTINCNFTVRPATAADAGELGRIHAESWLRLHGEYASTEFREKFAPATRAESFRQVLEQRREYVALGLAGDRPAGFVSCGCSRDADACSAWGEVIALYVLPEFQRRGLGSALLRHGLGYLRGEGCHQAVLWTAAINRDAISFYRRHGFAADGQEKNVNLGLSPLRACRYCCQL